jgi:hypothetical protein
LGELPTKGSEGKEEPLEEKMSEGIGMIGFQLFAILFDLPGTKASESV